MRKMEIIIEGVKQIVDFYQKTAFSTWVLATGQTGYQFFNNIEASNLRNYTKGQNIFEQNQGRVLAYQLFLLDSAQAAPTWTPALATAWETVRNSFVMVTDQDSTVSDSVSGVDIGEPAPKIIGASVAVANFDGGSALVKPSAKRAKYFEPPLMVANGRSINMTATLIGASIPAALNGYYLRLVAFLDEMPQTNATAVRT